MFDGLHFAVLGIILGILAIKVPYQYNPFRLKFGIGDNTEWGRVLPKVVGWILIVICGLWLGLVLALIVLAKFHS